MTICTYLYKIYKELTLILSERRGVIVDVGSCRFGRVFDILSGISFKLQKRQHPASLRNTRIVSKFISNYYAINKIKTICLFKSMTINFYYSY